jgi:hypothetical protein
MRQVCGGHPMRRRWESVIRKDEGKRIRTHLNLIEFITSNDELHASIPLLQNLNPLRNLRFTPTFINHLPVPKRIKEKKTRPTSEYAAA